MSSTNSLGSKIDSSPTDPGRKKGGGKGRVDHWDPVPFLSAFGTQDCYGSRCVRLTFGSSACPAGGNPYTTSVREVQGFVTVYGV